jgi:argininosuccinate lyase
MKKKMWDGRFESGMASAMVDLSFSLHFDQELIREDVAGTLAHCAGLVQSGILTPEEFKLVQTELPLIRDEILQGKDLFSAEDEDIHMALERILTIRIGEVGKKIHTGRSRNDQVATDFKVYLRRASSEILEHLVNLQSVVLKLAKDNIEHIMPGYTHLQQAQPILFSHYILSLFWALERDKKRYKSFLEIHNSCPLGSGAMAGSAFPYQRDLVAGALGFKTITDNSIDAVSHRDAALEFLSHAAVLISGISRYAEDFVIWSSLEFGFLSLHDSFSSGSSMMPQKKNPDSMELIRGKAGRIIGNFTSLYTTVKGSPLSYSRDLQEDKEPIFDTHKTVMVILRVMAEALATANFKFSVMEKKMESGLLATDLADLLVEKGIPFRDAHHLVGVLVGKAVANDCAFTELPDDDWASVPGFDELRRQLSFRNSVERRNIAGGTGSASVQAQIIKAEQIIRDELRN